MGPMTPSTPSCTSASPAVQTCALFPAIPNARRCASHPTKGALCPDGAAFNHVPADSEWVLEARPLRWLAIPA